MRKLLGALVILVLFHSGESFASREVLFSGNARIQQTATGYNFLHGAASGFNIDGNRFRQFVPRPAILSKFKVELSGSPGQGKSIAFTVRAGGIDTLMTCTVADLNLSCSYDLPVEVGAGQVLLVKEIPLGVPSAVNARYSVVLTTSSNREIILTGGKAITIITTPVPAYIPPHGGTATEITSEFLARTTMPFSGKVTELHVNSIQGSGQRVTTFTTYLKGSVTSQTCTAIENVGTCSDVNPDHAVSFKKGESLSVFNSGVFIPQHSGIALVVVPDEKDILLSALSGTTKVSSTANRYQFFLTGSAAWNGAESNVLTLAQNGMITKPAKILSMYVQGDAIPTGGSYTITLRRNQASTAFSCTISSMSMTPECEVLGNLTIQDGDEYDLLVVPAGMIQIPAEPRGDGGDVYVETVPSPIYINAGFKLNLKQRRTSIIN